MNYLKVIVVDLKCRLFLFYGGSSRLEPLNYGDQTNINGYNLYSIIGGKFPTTDWLQDNYSIWLRQNLLNNQYSIFGSVLSMIGNTIVGGARASSGDVARWTF